MPLRMASLILVSLATLFKESLWDSLFSFKYFPGDSIASTGSIQAFLENGFGQVIIPGFALFVNRNWDACASN